ncbi:hypothetical protein A3C87_03400 [Candidatus Kaiserbacteria bacterium RIFCSPHIGHO2_02_FULL_49_34]|uniref:Uncharacterized protein n=1 Tax=Candidatus Kaiserbacteria bacterium RIFCSPHIGHO2_02_FULL_49_34 TaxID=1798491 RepID=A0A1F6DI90_9BACT|nr:MAG: hypothetical protein A3C87_03400 [Candidatus Kaiserbacteria bacterium RIFCSPHIGHO2_02_FULL_49_34]
MNLFKQHREMHRLFEELAHEPFWSEYYELAIRHLDLDVLLFEVGRSAQKVILCNVVSSSDINDPSLQFFRGESRLPFADAVNLLLDPSTEIHIHGERGSGNLYNLLVQIVMDLQRNVVIMRKEAQESNSYTAFEQIMMFERKFFPSMKTLLRKYQRTSWQSYGKFAWLFLSLRNALTR